MKIKIYGQFCKMYLDLLHNVEVAIKKSNKKIELQICNDSEESRNDGIMYSPR